jgi:hypothetical protein
MCAGCAITAASAATGLRTWLQARGYTWLTPARLRRITLAAMVAAGVVSTVGFSGSTPPAKAAQHQVSSTPPAHAAKHHLAVRATR